MTANSHEWMNHTAIYSSRFGDFWVKSLEAWVVFFYFISIKFLWRKVMLSRGEKNKEKEKGKKRKKKKMKPKILIHEFYKWLTVQSAYLDINSWYSLRCWRIECFILVLFIWCHLFLTSAWSHRDHPQQIGREKYVMLLLI